MDRPFDSVSEVNAWDDAAKSLWISVRLVGRAQNAFKQAVRRGHPSELRCRKSSPEGSVRTCKQERTLRGRVPDTTEAAFGRLGIVRRRRNGPRQQLYQSVRKVLENDLLLAISSVSWTPRLDSAVGRAN